MSPEFKALVALYSNSKEAKIKAVLHDTPKHVHKSFQTPLRVSAKRLGISPREVKEAVETKPERVPKSPFFSIDKNGNGYFNKAAWEKYNLYGGIKIDFNINKKDGSISFTKGFNGYRLCHAPSILKFRALWFAKLLVKEGLLVGDRRIFHI